MRKWIITWNAGFGESIEVIDAETHDEALEDVYQAWKEEAENNATYDAKPYSEALAKEYGLE